MSSNTAKTVAVLFFVFLGAPEALTPPLMLAVSAITDLLIAIGFSREEPEPISQKSIKHKHINQVLSFRTFYKGIVILGIIEAAAVLFSYFTTMSYFGFTVNSLLFTRYHKAFNATNGIYNASYPSLGNPLIDFSNPGNPNVCEPGKSYPSGRKYNI
jgi:magnesium-transporting ATPase (P-type)